MNASLYCSHQRGIFRKGNVTYPKDTVILHQIGRGPYAPSMTPYAVKLETYLRMAKIPYQNCHDMKPSGKGKWPWVEYNDDKVSDSALCITYLNRVRGVDLNSRLTPAERATALAFQRLAEDSLYWVLLVQRWVHEPSMEFFRACFGVFFVSRIFLRWIFMPKMKKYAWSQGLGRHSRDEVLDIARENFKALADFMGQKKFLMGDEPCETDCTVFGMLSQVYWQCPGQTVATIFKEEFPTLVAYCERMRSKFWPDWDECTTHGGTREATK
ncbi:hypothetical protein BaRGS_00039349 [Batillaria attramentaria]|uniref:Uncharacterized protein n=1 Tax=Batillaria attramentaria TaxID=370345 RepID=A0ABD0J378_9CAEN